MEASGKNFHEIVVGEEAELTKTVSQKDIELFAQATGDFNPVHLDEQYARNSFFGQRVAHGMLSAGLISAVLGTRLPGPGTIYLSQQLRFLAPVKIGDTICARCRVLEKNEEKKTVVLRTTVTNQEGKLVVDGEARVMKREKK